jgi:hypothetical protein
MAMMAITTNNSIRVKAGLGLVERTLRMVLPQSKKDKEKTPAEEDAG